MEAKIGCKILKDFSIGGSFHKAGSTAEFTEEQASRLSEYVSMCRPAVAPAKSNDNGPEASAGSFTDSIPNKMVKTSKKKAVSTKSNKKGK